MRAIILEAQDIKVQRWNASQLWHYRPLRDSMIRSSKLFFYEYDLDLRLFYRLSRTDTIWNEIRPELPQRYCEEEYLRHFVCDPIHWDEVDRWHPDMAFNTVSWSQGKLPVALVTVTLGMSGSGGSTTWVGINVLELTTKPRLLLSALTSHVDQWHGAGDDCNETYHGWTHQVSLGSTLRIGQRHLEGDRYRPHITSLTPGRYQYRDGHLVWVGP